MLKKARELMIKKKIIADGSQTDKERFPTYEPGDSIGSTPRELTLKLIKQHDFLLYRVIALSETIHKHKMGKYAEGVPHLLRDIDAEETLSR